MSANVSCFVRLSSSMMSQSAKCGPSRVLPHPRISDRIRGARAACYYYPQQPRTQKDTRRGGSGLLGSSHATAASSFLLRRGEFPRTYTQAASTLTREQLHDLVYRLNEDERELLMNTLKQFESNKVKAEFEAETVPPPATAALMKLGLLNALPFIGFGFLDNFTMIIAGDYIEHTLGLFMCISTMAAAALGNTISDVIGIGSAFYVEKLAEMSGVKPPKLSPIQLEMKSSRRAANLGRVVGITIGCLLGMCPLLFKTEDKEKDKDKEKSKPKAPTKDNQPGEAVVAVAEK
ncbi:transmembrane protein 65 isoform X2 [Anopheles bellator]|uniref:transmembrane protein 65 isoform X2 n=1 Tax=Anopheles bellator TaxID=139047 RepID=UPI0026494BA1|nr:transmembrane protein 65 isoform X2 [Anopheles bellator]